jgi:predicted transposase YdaD
VEELVREFVPRGLVADPDFSGLERVNVKFHPARRSARRREADVIWRLPSRKGSDIHVYLLIEFQSDIDEWMAIRTQVYEVLLWQQVIDEYKLRASTRLPPLLSLVLYNAQQRWRAATTGRELIALPPDSTLWPWQPYGRYYLCDMGAFSQDELARRSSLVALLFRLERRHSTKQLGDLADEVIRWFRRHTGYQRLRRVFTELIREAIARHRVKMPRSRSLFEMRSMLTIDNTAWHAQLRAEFLAEGKAEGLVQGKS